MAPLVSVLMPVYNAGRFLRDSVECVLQQSIDDFELVIVDDGSTDKGIEILQCFGDPRIRVVRHGNNRGLAAARNTCLDSASGVYVAWLDADDRCHPSRLHEQLKVLTQYPEVGLCGTWVKTFGGDTVHRWRYPIDSDTLKSRMIFDDPFATSSVMIRRNVLKGHHARFDHSFPPAEDYDLWEKLSRVTSLANIAKYLTYYRLHQKQTSNTLLNRQAAAVWRIQERQIAQLGLRPTEEEKEVHLKLGVRWNFTGDETWIERARNWLEKLSQANEKKDVFPKQAFAAVVADRWYRVCRGHTKAGMEAWRIFKATPLAASYNGNLASKVRLALCAMCRA